MAQVNVQFDDKTLRALENRAARNHTTVAEWISNHIKLGLKEEWPRNYFSLFGALDEDDLSEPGEIPTFNDARRDDL